MRAGHSFVIAAVLLACACGSKPTTPPISSSTSEQRALADVAVEALQAGDFERAGAEASSVLRRDVENSRAAAVAAFVAYEAAGHELVNEVGGVIDNVMRSGFDGKRLHDAFVAADDRLERVVANLDIASRDSAFELDLCIACWERDWNHNGEVDDRDRHLFEVEFDHYGKHYPDGDPRRRPKFRFDRGDVYWALAMVSFQRAALNVLAGYDWSGLNALMGNPQRVNIHLSDADRVKKARDLILAGLAHAEKSRQLYLAETDDEREWVPNPRQKDHGLPLPVDEQLYERWGAILGDLEKLVRGKAGLSVAEVAQLGDHEWANPPRGYIDIGAMLSSPRDIDIDIARIETIDNSKADDAVKVEGLLKEILGVYYKMDMESSKLTGRMRDMREQVERGEDTLDRKLRYLLYLN